jgi:RND family efflux transporter MFP subunit
MKTCRALVATALAALVLGGCSKTQTGAAGAKAETARPIATEAVREESVRRAIDVVGTLAAEEQVTISSQADGQVSKVLVDLGDRVRAGQVLIELDREKLQYNLELQKAALTRALTKYGATEPTRLPPIEQTPDVQKASAELVQARQAHDRARELFGRSLLPRQALDDAAATLGAKQASYDAAVQNAQSLGVDVESSSATLKLANRQLRDASIRAPFDGYVQRRMVSLGEFVKSEMPVISLVRMDTLKVTAEIPEKMTPWIKVGQTVDISVDAFRGKPITGQVSRISPAVNTPTRAFPFEAVISNSDGLLKPGTFARVHLTTALVEPIVTIPYAAMQYRYGVYRAFTVNGDRLAIHELETGDRIGDRMEILSGLKVGERVALTDVDNLTDGLLVAADSRQE